MTTARSIIHVLLALVIASWTPVCLCHAERGRPEGPTTASHDGGHTHGCCRHRGEPTRPSDRLPCEHPEGTGCRCGKVLAAPAKADPLASVGLPHIAVAMSWPAVLPPAALPITPARRVMRCAADRPGTTLLGLHCALTI